MPEQSRHPFVIAISSYGHLDVRFVESRGEPYSKMRYLPASVQPELPWLQGPRWPSGDIVVGLAAFELSMDQQGVREMLTNVRRRVDLWLGPYSMAGSYLFAPHIDPIGLQFTHSIPNYLDHARDGILFIEEVPLRFGQDPSEFHPAGYAAPVVAPPAPELTWATAMSPLPESEVDPGEWFVWNFALVLGLFPGGRF